MEFQGLDISLLSRDEIYKILIGSIVPRPIAWVGTVSKDNLFNLAPFSFFTAAGTNPPTVLFCPVNSPTGREKDTLRNIRETKEFVINIATENLVEQMNQTSAEYPPGVSEFEKANLTPLKGIKVSAPRVASSPIQLECKLLHLIDLGPKDAAGSGHIVAGQLVYAHIASEICDAHFHIDVKRLKPVSRLAGTFYAPVHDIFSLERPKIQNDD